MEKTYDFLIKPLKKWPTGNHGKHIFFLEIEIVTTKIVNSKKFEKNLSSASVDDGTSLSNSKVVCLQSEQ